VVAPRTPARTGRLQAAAETARAAVLGTSSTGRRLRAVDESVRGPVGTSRRLTVLSADGGVGGTTLAAVAAGLYASRRSGPVLGVDLARGPAGLAARSGVDAPVGLDMLRSRPAVTSLAAARDGIPLAPSGAWVAGSGEAEGASWPGAVPDWQQVLAAVGRFFEVVVTDAGRRTPDDAVALAAGSHATAVVVRPDVASVDAGRALLAAVTEGAPGARALLVVVATGGRTPDAPGVRGAGLDGAGLDRALHVPHDRAAARSLAGPLSGLGLTTRLALGEVAARLLDDARRRPTEVPA
jgi:hypothetical protein